MMENGSKGKLIEKIQNCDNPYLLKQLEALVNREKALDPLGNFSQEYPILLESHTSRDLRIFKNMESPVDNPLSRYDTKVTPYFFYISVLMLMISAAILNSISHDEENLFIAVFQAKTAAIYWSIWFVYLLDFGLILFLARKHNQKIATGEFIFRIFALAFPPLRMVSRHIQNIELVWVPFFGWSQSNEGLLKLLKRKFSLPMIFIALLILPVLIVEWKFYDEVSTFLETDLTFLLDMVQAFIWMAFAFEFILMFSVSNERLDYVKRNWIDVVIILLPFIAFVRSIRLIKIARLTQIARGYKLRGILMKARQGLIFANFFYRILTIKPTFQIKNLKKQLDKNQREREEIEEQLIELYRVLKAKKAT
ncbi:hypothetical protein KIH41_03210 [Litoribacter ruber]|uniref:hypothetical protein n=1 Tax=Litoribacter ruber TaxID=702568 RepID=UPI001BDB60CA|nr:hypothetical protein [Litoribacter ruber]MBT0810280.1 hypothetical protein [Litoribacter ruber]